MNCANILIVYFDDNDPETNEVKGWLKEKYQATRSVNIFKCSYDGKADPCFVQQGSKSAQKDGKEDYTGIYVLQHGGGEGQQASGFVKHLATEPVRKAFAKWLLLLAKSHKIRKLCIMACVAVETVTQQKARPVSADSGGKHGEIYVQQVCHAISAIDTEKTLDGLMVAGYTSGVTVVKEFRAEDRKKPEIKPNRVFKTLHQPKSMELAPKDDEAGLAKFLQERAKVLDKSMHPAWHVKPAVGKANVTTEEAKIKAYVLRKRVFVLKDGEWRNGKLSEYTDKDEAWKKDWKERLEKQESALFA